MDRFFLRLLLGICVAFFAHVAHASFPATSSPGVTFTGAGCGSKPPGVFATLNQACEAWRVLNGYGSYFTTAGTICGALGGTCQAPTTSGTAYSCPANATLSGSTCTCNSGFNQSGSTCVPAPSCPAAGTKNGRMSLEVPLSWNGDKFYTHDDDGCVSEVNASTCVTYDGKKVCEGSATYTGGSSSGSGDGLGNDAPSTPDKQQTGDDPMSPTSCPTGQCPGTINGLNVCKPCGTVSTAKPKVEEKINSDGTSEKKESVDKTTCTGSNCTTATTTTTTTKDAAGSVTGATTVTVNVEQSKGDYCRDNPNATQCKDDKGEWGGSCESGFTCSGDAVMCAMSRAVHQQSCDLNKPSDESALYGSSKGATGNQTGDAPGNESIAFGSSHYSDVDLIGGAACISDLPLQLSAFGMTLIDVTLPLSDICPFMEWLRYILLFCSAIGWLYIVFLRG